jgi:hypothetical protein
MPRKYESDPMYPLGACSVCGNVRTLNLDGTLRVHGNPTRRGMNCNGSGWPPKSEPGPEGERP